MKLALLLSINLMMALPSCAQVLAGGSGGKRARVTVPVVVSDRDGRRVPGLEKGDFRIYQGGAERKISSFSDGGEPVSVALLIDTSASTRGVLDRIKDAAEDFVGLLRPGDRCLIATFDSAVNVLAGFTADRKMLGDSIERIATARREGTVLFSALERLTRKEFAGIPGRKAIVVLSDGRDVGSAVARHDLMSWLDESDVSVYPVLYQGRKRPEKEAAPPAAPSAGRDSGPVVRPEKKTRKRKGYTVYVPIPGDTYSPSEVRLMDTAAATDAVEALRTLAGLTLGRFYASDEVKLKSVFRQVGAELRQQYLISFNTDAPGEARVTVGRPGLVVQSRGRALGIGSRTDGNLPGNDN